MAAKNPREKIKMALSEYRLFSVGTLAAAVGTYSSTSAVAQAFSPYARRYAGYIEGIMQSASGILTANFQHGPTVDGPWRTLLTTSLIANQSSNVVYESQSIVNAQALAPFGRVTLGLASEAGGPTRFDQIVAKILTEPN